MNPKGILSSSPGLTRSGYPGFETRIGSQPQRGCGPEWSADRRNRVAVETLLHRIPRVARASQPWADSHCPVGASRARARADGKPAHTVTSMISSVIGPELGSPCFSRLWRYPWMASRISWKIRPASGTCHRTDRRRTHLCALWLVQLCPRCQAAPRALRQPASCRGDSERVDSHPALQTVRVERVCLQRNSAPASRRPRTFFAGVGARFCSRW